MKYIFGTLIQITDWLKTLRKRLFKVLVEIIYSLKILVLIILKKVLIQNISSDNILT